MPTQKRRLNLSLPEEVELALSHLANRDGVSMSGKALDLLQSALEMHEDEVLVEIAEQRMRKNKQPLVSHEEIWNDL